MSKVRLRNGVDAWAFSYSQYVQSAVKNVEGYLDKKGMKLKKNVKAPFTSNYRPEIDGSDELDDEGANYFQSLIGAGDRLTHRSRTEYIVFLNMAPIYWLSKKQASIETSSFGSEFIAVKQCCHQFSQRNPILLRTMQFEKVWPRMNG